MAIADLNVGGRPMCSLVTKGAGEDPIGSVASFDRLLLIEVPLPWPRAIRTAPRFPAAVDAALTRADAAGISCRVYGIVPDPAYTPAGLTRLISLQRPGRSMSVFDKEDFVVPREVLGSLVQAVLDQSPALAAFAEFRQDTTHLRDVLVCTHGTRDRCCASFGYPVYRKLRHASSLTGPRPSRAWRVSHIGGHRFAPTLIDLPDGRCWAHMNDDALAKLMHQGGEVPDLARHYRGWAALRGVPEMVAERAIFAEQGWEWATRTVASEIVVPADPITDRTQVRITFAGIDGRDPGYYDVTVEPTGVVTTGIGSCGDEDPSEHRQYHVTRMTRHELSRPARRFALAG
ncbi:MAG: hypothetical protein H0V24_15930 [Chloroflexia bacterium]|nr:hypothetical protein [Chloroflexia bacterium]